MQTDSSGGHVSTTVPAGGVGRMRGRSRIEVSNLRASQVSEYAHRRAASGADVHVERRGGRTFLVTTG